jgi:uncharacterized protein (TIGR03437 family)
MSATTVRMIVRPTVSGASVRVRIENTMGQSPVTFSAAYIGQVQSGAALAAGSNTQLTFSGSPGLTLAAGAGAYSDPLPFPVAAFARYAVSLDVTTSQDISAHRLGLVTNYMAAGAHAADTGGGSFSQIPDGDTGTNAGPSFPVYWVTSVDVQTANSSGTVVAFGDSITDGECSTRTDNGASSGAPVPDVYNRWTDLLASRFAMLPPGQGKAVADEGIAGNRVVVSGGEGPAAVARFGNDVLGRAGATHVIFFEGTNDIANGGSAQQVIAADQQIISSAQAAGLKIIGATILPRGGDGLWTSAMEQQRQLLNDWIRHQAAFDALIDFDALMQGSTNSKTNIPSIPPQWSCFDGVHPNSAGYAAMSGAIDLTLFQSGAVAPPAVQPPAALTYIAGSSTKLEQMLGDCDFQAQAQQIVKGQTPTCSPTASRTVTKYNILGTDIGYSFEDNGKAIFLFGDTISGNPATANYHAADAFASTTSTDPDSGTSLNFYTTASGTPLFVQPPGVAMGADDVPNSGISLPDGVYMVINTGADTTLPNPHQNDSSVLAKFNEATQTFSTLRTISKLPGGHFIITAPHASGSDVMIFGIGQYRASDIYLAKVPASGFATGAGTQYFTGLVNGQPAWSNAESDAVPVVQDGTAGNVSVAYSNDLGLWLMTYDGGRQSPKTNGAYFTYSRQPWGPWAAPQLIFNRTRDNAYGVFIHNPAIVPDPPGDGLNGPTIGGNDVYTTAGGEYAPLMIERFTTVSGSTLKIYYTMSTWNPYTVVKMRSEFTIVQGPQITAGGVVIHAGVSPAVSPGSLVDIYGTNLAAAPVSAPAGSTLPTNLGGVEVMVNGAAAPLIYVSPTLIVFQLPYETAVGTAQLTVTSNGAASAAAPVTVQQAAPSILTYSNNRAVVLNQDYSVNGPANPAKVGSTAMAYLIGGGPLDNPIATGATASTTLLSRETLPVTVTVGSATAVVPFAGMAPGFAGLVQVNFTVPNLPANDYPLQVKIGSAASNQPLVAVGN